MDDDDRETFEDIKSSRPVSRSAAKLIQIIERQEAEIRELKKLLREQTD